MFSQDEYLLPTTSKPLIYLCFLRSYNYTPTIRPKEGMLFRSYFLFRNHPSTCVSWLPFWEKAKTVLQEQVQCQGQQGISGILLACHQEQKEHHQQILNVKILGQQLAQKPLRSEGNWRPIPARRHGRGSRRSGRRWRRRTLAGSIPGSSSGILHPVSAVSTVRLGNIAIVHVLTSRRGSVHRHGETWRPAPPFLRPA